MTLRLVLGILIGGGIGGLLGYFGKCSSGACPLTANPWRGMLVGGLMGLVLAWSMGGNVTSNPSHERDAKEGGLYIGSESDFEELVLKSNKPVMVDFFSPACGACTRLSPTISLLKDRYEGKAAVYKVDASKLSALADKYDVQVVPTVSFFEGGEYLGRVVGAKPADVYVDILDEVLEGANTPLEGDKAMEEGGEA